MDSRILHKECLSLSRAGYRVTLIAPHTQNTEVAGVSIRAVRPPAGRWSRVSLTLAEIWRLAVRADADLYHLHDPELLPLGLALRCRGKKVIYDVHDHFPELAAITNYRPLRGPLNRLPSPFIRAMENLAAPRMSAIVAAVEDLGERFVLLNPKCVVVHNLPIPQELAPLEPISWRQRTSSVTYIGTFTRWRGLFELVQAMDFLPPQLDCAIVLAGSLKPHWRRQIARLPGYHKVRIVGPLDRSGVRDLLATVRAGLSVFHPLPFIPVSWPIKIFEYMAAGIPVIASDFPLWHEFLGEPPAGLFVDPLDPKSVANAIEYILGHPREAEQMGQLGRRMIEERYNWASEEQKLLHLYEELSH